MPGTDPIRPRRSRARAALTALALLGACTPHLDVSETELRDGVLYAIGGEEPFTGVVTKAFPDSVSDVSAGVVLSETTYVEGVTEGERVEYHPNGQTARRVDLVRDTMQGVLREWDERGQLLLEQEMVDGKPSGAMTAWYPDGTPAAQGTYLNGALHGELQRWYANGQLRLRRGYHNGFPHGESREWYEDGSPLVEGGYANGHVSGRYRRWHPNGRLALDGEYFRGRSTEIRMWDEEGNELQVEPDIRGDETAR